MIEVIKADHISIITLDRPDTANALSLKMLDDLNKTLDSIDKDPDIFCTILTGSGEKAFCAGADLKERSGMTDSEVIQTVRYIGETVRRVERMRMPVIAAINGAAYGGGLELALACDIRIAADHAKIGLTETSLAIIPGAGGTQRLPRLIGTGQAKRFIYTAKPVDAKEAYRLGIVEEISRKDELLNDATNLASVIVKNGPIALEQAKIAINQGIKANLETGLEIEHICYKQTISTKDRQEGLLAFKEKRKPNYKGQ